MKLIITLFASALISGTSFGTTVKDSFIVDTIYKIDPFFNFSFVPNAYLNSTEVKNGTILDLDYTFDSAWTTYDSISDSFSDSRTFTYQTASAKLTSGATELFSQDSGQLLFNSTRFKDPLFSSLSSVGYTYSFGYGKPGDIGINYFGMTNSNILDTIVPGGTLPKEFNRIGMGIVFWDDNQNMYGVNASQLSAHVPDVNSTLGLTGFAVLVLMFARRPFVREAR